MAKRETVIVESFGQLFRMSKPQYVKWLRAVASGGEEVSIPGHVIGIVNYNATDITTERAQAELDNEVERDLRAAVERQGG